MREKRVQEALLNEKMACLELTVKKLQSQLLMSADHNLSWRDERLKLSLNELERPIGKTANQIALSGLIPRGRQLPNRLAFRRRGTGSWKDAVLAAVQDMVHLGDIILRHPLRLWRLWSRCWGAEDDLHKYVKARLQVDAIGYDEIPQKLRAELIENIIKSAKGS